MNLLHGMIRHKKTLFRGLELLSYSYSRPDNPCFPCCENAYKFDMKWNFYLPEKNFARYRCAEKRQLYSALPLWLYIPIAFYFRSASFSSSPVEFLIDSGVIIVR